MSRLAVVLLVAAFLLTAPGLAPANEEEKRSGRASAAQSEAVEACPATSEASWSGMARYCPARRETTGKEKVGVQQIPVYVPPNRGSLPTRIGGASRGGV